MKPKQIIIIDPISLQPILCSEPLQTKGMYKKFNKK